VQYYTESANSGEAQSPKHIFINGLGELNTVKENILSALT